MKICEVYVTLGFSIHLPELGRLPAQTSPPTPLGANTRSGATQNPPTHHLHKWVSLKPWRCGDLPAKPPLPAPTARLSSIPRILSTPKSFTFPTTDPAPPPRTPKTPIPSPRTPPPSPIP